MAGARGAFKVATERSGQSGCHRRGRCNMDEGHPSAMFISVEMPRAVHGGLLQGFEKKKHQPVSSNLLCRHSDASGNLSCTSQAGLSVRPRTLPRARCALRASPPYALCANYLQAWLVLSTSGPEDGGFVFSWNCLQISLQISWYNQKKGTIHSSTISCKQEHSFYGKPAWQSEAFHPLANRPLRLHIIKRTSPAFACGLLCSVTSPVISSFKACMHTVNTRSVLLSAGLGLCFLLFLPHKFLALTSAMSSFPLSSMHTVNALITLAHPPLAARMPSPSCLLSHLRTTAFITSGLHR